MAGGGYDLEEIRRRANVVEIISPHVALRRAGRRLVGLCPFHRERTPSFTVDPETGLWHCFGCKAGGDLFRFVEMIEKASFSEAVELLARRLGVQPRQRASPARQRERERMLTVHEQAAKLFQAALRGKMGGAARAYLQTRGIAQESIEGFGLGYAPDSWDGLLNAMGKKGFSAQEVAAAGLAVPREDHFYDRFRNRLMFPIRDATGRVIAFGGRSLEEEQEPKYLNSPEQPLFQKGRTLYALDRARRAMAEAERAIVVEGYLDAIACHEAGFAEAVATMGTALTAEHVDLLRRRVPVLVLALDADSAGLSAALRARDMFFEAGLAVRMAALPEGADPDQVIRERGPEAFRELVEAAAPIVEWELSRILASAKGADERVRMEALQEAVSTLGGVPAGVEREYYVRWLAHRSGGVLPTDVASMETAVRQELAREAKRRAEGGRRIGPDAEADASARSQGASVTAAGRLQASVLALFLHNGELAARYSPTLEAEDFATEELRNIFAAIRGLVERKETISPQAVLAQISPEARERLAELAIEGVPEERIEESLASAVRRLLEKRLHRQEGVIRQRLEGAESEGEREALLRELTEHRRRREELARQRLVGEQ